VLLLQALGSAGEKEVFIVWEVMVSPKVEVVNAELWKEQKGKRTALERTYFCILVTQNRRVWNRRVTLQDSYINEFTAGAGGNIWYLGRRQEMIHVRNACHTGEKNQTKREQVTFINNYQAPSSPDLLEKPQGRAESIRAMELVKLEDSMNSKSPRGLEIYRNSSREDHDTRPRKECER
jgi:hypothetical protein